MSGKSTVAERFEKLGLYCAEDFALHLPLRYEDHSQLSYIVDLQPGRWGQFEADVVSAHIQKHPRRTLVVTVRDDNDDELNLRFLNFYPSQITQMKEGKRLRVQGELRRSLWGDEMVHPKVLSPHTELSSSLVPIYPSTDKLTQAQITKAIRTAMTQVLFDEVIPIELLKNNGLMPLREALTCLHAPALSESIDALNSRHHPAWRRIKFDELLAQQLSLVQARQERTILSGPVKARSTVQRRYETLTRAHFLERLSFKLTASQEKVLDEILRDFTYTYPMNRLLQGDVGSGKTVVAALAAQHMIQQGYQVAIMAPTEILAEQHFKKMSEWFTFFGVSVVLLSGSLRAKAKRDVLENIQNGRADLVVGTHALIQGNVHFSRLGLVIADEQHRFGVAQRLALREKAGNLATDYDLPHHLMMTATPIPRTLAMTFFADLEVSSIEELPPGRTPILTKLFSLERRNEVLSVVHQAAKQRQQVYWVCPLIEESEQLDLLNAVETHQTLCAVLEGLNVGLLHGKMPTPDKDAVMQAFVRGEVDVLVATTVIEVGVDVPNASLMVIEHAERFGLAQLHQLRGRVGRGSHASVCVLIYQSPLSMLAKERLRVIHQTQDGFEIARQDLKIRGPGEVLGARQSGMAMLRYADLESDAVLAEKAYEVAHALVRDYPSAVVRHLDRWMRYRRAFLKA